tara:strand:+ start:285 stop:590 length:306 start_codon:yes stop_codon:yes gene_type:complete
MSSKVFVGYRRTNKIYHYKYKHEQKMYQMSPQPYLILSLFAIFGVFLSYCIPVIGNVLEDAIVLVSNGLIISIIIKNKFVKPKTVQIVEDDEDVELTTAFE